MSQALRIGIIGTDTSHAVAFTELLNNRDHAYHVAGCQVVKAFPGGSADFELSASRVERFAQDLNTRFQVELADSPEAAVEGCDAVLLESADGRVHLEQFRRIAPLGKPVFIDKPLALTVREAEEIASLAAKHGVQVMSSSALRYAEALRLALEGATNPITGADCFGPMAIEPTQPGFFWYGIHTVEMLFAVLGPGCAQLSVVANNDHDLITAKWKDGRIGTVRGNRIGSHQFGASLHSKEKAIFVDIGSQSKPFYASLLEQVVGFFQTGVSPLPIEQTIEIVRFLEAANESRETGAIVRL